MLKFDKNCIKNNSIYSLYIFEAIYVEAVFYKVSQIEDSFISTRPNCILFRTDVVHFIFILTPVEYTCN